MARHAAVVEAFKALGDPIRWEMVRQIGAVEELPCGTLEDTLPVTKPTISYHAKILMQAGLLDVRKDGRNSYYRLCREILDSLQVSLEELSAGTAPTAVNKPVVIDAVDQEPESRRSIFPKHPTSTSADSPGPVLLTW